MPWNRASSRWPHSSSMRPGAPDSRRRLPAFGDPRCTSVNRRDELTRESDRLRAGRRWRPGVERRLRIVFHRQLRHPGSRLAAQLAEENRARSRYRRSRRRPSDDCDRCTTRAGSAADAERGEHIERCPVRRRAIALQEARSRENQRTGTDRGDVSSCCARDSGETPVASASSMAVCGSHAAGHEQDVEILRTLLIGGCRDEGDAGVRRYWLEALCHEMCHPMHAERWSGDRSDQAVSVSGTRPSRSGGARDRGSTETSVSIICHLLSRHGDRPMLAKPRTSGEWPGNDIYPIVLAIRHRKLAPIWALKKGLTLQPA